MKRLSTILLGIATFWPLIDTLIFIFLWFAIMFAMFGSSTLSGPPPAFDLAMKFQTFTALFSMPLLVIYYVHLFRNPKIARDRKLLWAVLLFVALPFSMPIYWYRYFWQS